MLCGSAFKNKGVQPLLDAVVDFLPSPLEAKPIVGIDPKTGDEITRKPDDNEPFAALAFKIATDPYGNLTYFRVYSGVLEKGSYVYNARSGQKERIGRILRMHANHREDIDSIGAGDIAAAVGLTDTRTGDTLCDEKHADPARDRSRSPSPSSRRRSSRRPRAIKTSWASRCTRLAQEDPTFRMRTDEETQQTIIAGMGELHLEIILDRLKREFKVEANVGKPQVAYKEAITKTVEKQGTLRPAVRRQGSVRRRLDPPRAAASRVRASSSRSKIVGGAVPKEYVEAGSRGHPRSLRRAACSPGYPVLDFKATLFDGSYHDVDSSEMAFKIAGFDGVQGSQSRGRARSCSSRS